MSSDLSILARSHLNGLLIWRCGIGVLLDLDDLNRVCSGSDGIDECEPLPLASEGRSHYNGLHADDQVSQARARTEGQLISSSISRRVKKMEI